MKQIRIRKRKVAHRHDHDEVLPLDPRDPDVVRVKEAARMARSVRKAA